MLSTYQFLPGSMIRLENVDTKEIVFSEQVPDGRLSLNLNTGRYVMSISHRDKSTREEFTVGTQEEVKEMDETKFGGTMTSQGTSYKCPKSGCDYRTFSNSTMLQHHMEHKTEERKQAKIAKSIEDATALLAEKQAEAKATGASK